MGQPKRRGAVDAAGVFFDRLQTPGLDGLGPFDESRGGWVSFGWHAAAGSGWAPGAGGRPAAGQKHILSFPRLPHPLSLSCATGIGSLYPLNTSSFSFLFAVLLPLRPPSSPFLARRRGQLGGPVLRHGRRGACRHDGSHARSAPLMLRTRPAKPASGWRRAGGAPVACSLRGWAPSPSPRRLSAFSERKGS